MNTISRNLPGFCTYREFFNRLGGPFENVIPAEGEKKMLVQALQRIDGAPGHEFRQLRDDLDLTARVREVRRYGGNRTFVRFEYQRLIHPAEWGLPLQLMVLFGRNRRILAYTVLQGRGRLTDGVRFSMTAKRYDWDSYRKTEDMTEALRFLKRNKTGEIAVTDKATGAHVLYAYAGMSPRGKGYDIEWYLGCVPWLLTAKGVGYEAVEDAIKALLDGGVTALEEALPWRQFDFRESYCRDGVKFEIDLELNRYLLRAERDGDETARDAILAVGLVSAQKGEPRSEKVSYGSADRMLQELSDLASGGTLPDRDAAAIDCYLALRGRRDNIHNLGWRFHFGSGVKADYRQAICWQEKSAAMGDAFSMQNLGVIYSEAGSPVHDCTKAREWFEKAVALGDTYAMGDLAHCLLCGSNGRDDARALRLARRAAEAHPDNAGFQRSYEKARNLN